MAPLRPPPPLLSPLLNLWRPAAACLRRNARNITTTSTPSATKLISRSRLDPTSVWHRLPAKALHTSHVRYNAAEPTPISTEKYHVEADETMDRLYNTLEALAETDTSVDVEFSAGVLTLSLPHGTYVINKQPPNRQIWLSSPISGPKRFDWVDGEWVYARDGSTLRGILEGEVGVKLDE